MKGTKFIIVLFFNPGMKSVIFFVCAAICILPGGKSKLYSNKLCVILLILLVLFLVLEENGYFSRATRGARNRNFQVPVVQKLDSAIHRINLCSVDSAIGFPNTYPLDSDLSGG